MFEEGFAIYIQLKSGEIGFLIDNDNKESAFLSKYWITRELDKALIFPTLKAAEARADSLKKNFENYLEYHEIMFFDGGDVCPLDAATKPEEEKGDFDF